MQPSTSTKTTSRIIAWTYATYATLIVVWIVAWLLKVNLDKDVHWLTTGVGGFAYWTVAKLFVWILPAVWLLKFSGRSISETFNVTNWKGWLLWGGGVGLLISLTGFIPKYLAGRMLIPSGFSLDYLSILTVAPIMEEFLMRGVILGNLQRGYSFWKANFISSLMFLGLHLPGWYFKGTLVENLSRPIGGALSIFLLGLIFGYIVYKSRSVIGGMLAHFLNNLAS